MDSKKILKYSKNIGTYFSASLIPMILSLVANPFIAKNMDPEDYAIVGYYASFTTLIQPLVTFYMLHFYTKRFYELDEEGRRELRSTLMKALIWFSGLLFLVGLAGVIIYSVFFNQDTTIPLFPYVLMSLLVLPLGGVMSLTLTDYRMSRKANSFFRLSVSNSILSLLLTLLFVVWIKWGAIGKLLAPLITSFVFFTYCVYKYRDLVKIPFNWAVFKQMLVFCWPLTIAAMLSFFSNGYDRVLLERLGNTKELGYYCVGLQIANYVNVFQTAITSTFQPDIFQNIAERNWKRLLSIIGIQIFGVCCIVGVFIIVAPTIVDILTAGRYLMAVGYTRILVFSSVVSVAYYCLSQITIALGYTQITLINKILSSIAMIVIYGFLVSRYQFVGAAWGQVLSYLVFLIGNAVLLFFFIRRKNAIKNI